MQVSTEWTTVQGPVAADTPVETSGRTRRPRGRSLLVGTAGFLALSWLAAPAGAVELNWGEVQGRLDTTLSYGLTYRIGDQDDTLAGKMNNNDGNLNYGKGIVSNTSKFTSDLRLDLGNLSTFARVTGFFDIENENGSRERTPLSPEAEEEIANDLELLDLYGSWGFELEGIPTDITVGRQVLNWGESTFIFSGLSGINPLDASKLRLPGSELREGLLPLSMASIAMSPTDNVSVEGFYQFDWASTRLDPVGSYFSTVDYVGPGARKAFVALPGIALTDSGLGPDSNLGLEPLVPLINMDLAGQQPLDFPDPDFLTVPRGPDLRPGKSGQYGLAVRMLTEDANDTEIGLFMARYHSRLPYVSVRTPEVGAIQAALGAAQAVSAPTSRTAAAVTQGVTQRVMDAVRAGLLNPAAAPQAIGEGVAAQLRGIATMMAVTRYGRHGRYFIEYPEDLPVYGTSFNTRLGASGWALQGEYTYRPDAALQIAERSILEWGLTPVFTGLQLAARDQALLGRYLANYQPATLPGYIKRDVSQVQATFTKAFGGLLGADGMFLLTEFAMMHIHNMPSQDVDPLESPAGSFGDDENDADATSYGYQVAARLDYNNAIGAVNLYPYVRFQHDMKGNSPAPIGPFVEGRTVLTLGLKAEYLSRWQFDLGATFYAGNSNELRDRDFVYTSVKYSF